MIALLRCGISIKSICASFLLGKVRIESLFPLEGELIRDSGTREGTTPDCVVRDISKEEGTTPDCVARDTYKKKRTLKMMSIKNRISLTAYSVGEREWWGVYGAVIFDAVAPKRSARAFSLAWSSLKELCMSERRKKGM